MNSPEYRSVLANKGDIVETLETTEGAKILARKYEERTWSDISTDQTAEKLVNTALNRIKSESNQFKDFFEMLRDIPGLDLIVAKLEKSLVEKSGTTDANPEQSTPLHDTSLGMTPEKSMTGASGAEMVGMSLPVIDKATKMIADNLDGCKTDVMSHQSRAPEPSPENESVTAENRSSIIPPKLESYNPGHSSTVPGDESHFHHDNVQDHDKTASDTLTEDVSTYQYHEHPTVKKTSSDPPTNRSVTASDILSEAASKGGIAVQEESYSRDPGYNSSQMDGSDSANCSNETPTLVGTQSTIENIGPFHDPRTTENPQPTTASPSTDASVRLPHAETDQDHTHSDIVAPKNTGELRHTRHQPDRQNHNPNVTATKCKCTSQHSLYDRLPQLFDRLKSLDSNVAICLVICTCVVAIGLCILLWYCLVYQSGIIGIIIGIILAKFK